MKGGIWLYFRYMGISFKAQLQYKASFIMEIAGHFLVTGIEFLGVYALFSRFGRLKDWSLAEVSLLYGLVGVIFALADMFSRGFDLCGQFVQSGDFDKYLLRPRSVVLQLLGYDFQLKRFGRLAQGLVVFLWGASQLPAVWRAGSLFIIGFAIAGGISLFMGLFILQATLSFWTVETLEMMNALTYGGVFTAQYPMSIYQDWFRKFFIFIVPLCCICYFPVLTLLGKTDAAHFPVWLGWVSPAAGIVFLVVSLQVWKLGVRHYTSTGS